MPTVELTRKAKTQIDELRRVDVRKHAKVLRALDRLAADPRHPGLQSHDIESFSGPNGEKLYESYVENPCPSAWRILWFYGPEDGKLTVASINRHP
jgi:hypothetical protein